MKYLQAYIGDVWKLNGAFWEAPCTLLVQGVHRGSAGAIFWASHILRRNAHKWEGVPLALSHPMVNGKPVSITHSREIRAAHEIGRVVKPYYDEARKGIRATLQIPRDHPRIDEIKRLREVSVGVFSDETQTFGRWGGEPFDACAISMTPDHLAILPEGQRGACSVTAGCGIRTNQNNDGGEIMDFTSEAVFPPEVLATKQQQDDLQALAQWEGVDAVPPEIQELRRKYGYKRQEQGQAQGYASEAVFPPEVKL